MSATREHAELHTARPPSHAERAVEIRERVKELNALLLAAARSGMKVDLHGARSKIYPRLTAIRIDGLYTVHEADSDE